VTGRLGRPERAAAQALQAKLGAEFLDPVLDVGAAVVTAPHLKGADARRQVGPQGLKLVPGHLEELFPAGVGPFGDTLAQDHKPGAVVGDVLHLDSRHPGRGPGGVIRPESASLARRPHCAKKRESVD
jgi:hypothetical protein